MNFALQGISIATFDEAVFEHRPPQLEKSTLILSMARSEAALHTLSAAEECGVPVLNSPRALQKHNAPTSNSGLPRVDMPPSIGISAHLHQTSRLIYLFLFGGNATTLRQPPPPMCSLLKIGRNLTLFFSNIHKKMPYS